MTSVAASLGTLLQVDDGAGNYTTVAEVRDIKGPALSTNTFEVTNHSSSDATEEFVVTTKSPGEVTFGINYLPTNATHNETAGLNYLWKNRTRRRFKIIMTDGSSSVIGPFYCYVTGFRPDFAVKGANQADVTLKVDGAVDMP